MGPVEQKSPKKSIPKLGKVKTNHQVIAIIKKQVIATIKKQVIADIKTGDRKY